MKTLRSFAVLAIMCLAIASCGNVKESHEMDIKAAETDLMRYNSVAQGVNKDGQVGLQLSLIGQAKAPSQTVTTQQVPVQVTTRSAAPQRPVYSRDTRASKAVERTPPASPPVEKTEMRTVVTTTTTYRGPEVLASTGGGGPSTGHSVAAQIPGAISGLGSAAIGGHYFKAGMKALRPAQTNINQNQTGGGASQVQGQGQASFNANQNNNNNNNTANASSASSAASSAAAAAAAAAGN